MYPRVGIGACTCWRACLACTTRWVSSSTALLLSPSSSVSLYALAALGSRKTLTCHDTRAQRKQNTTAQQQPSTVRLIISMAILPCDKSPLLKCLDRRTRYAAVGESTSDVCVSYHVIMSCGHVCVQDDPPAFRRWLQNCNCVRLERHGCSTAACWNSSELAENYQPVA